MSKNYFAFEPSQNESICKLNSDGTYAVNNNSGSVYSETSDWVDFDGGSGTYYLKVEGVDFSELSYSSYVSVRFKSGSSEVSMYADRGMNPHSRQITNPSQIKFEMAFENGVSAPNLKVMLSNGESEWESAFGGSEPEPQNGTVNVVAYYQNPNGSWPGSPETIRSVQQEVGTTFYTTSDDRTPKKSPSSGEYVYDSSTSDQSVLVSSAATYTVELRFKLNFTVTYTDGVSGTQVFADQVYSGLEYGESTPSFSGTPSRSGYDFNGWSPTVTSMVTADNTYTAQWTVSAPDTAQYTVQFFREANGSYPSSPSSSETRSGTIGTTVSTTSTDRTPPSGYAYDTSAPNVQSAVLQASGTVLKIYFKQQFTVQYTDGASGSAFRTQTYSNLDYGDSTPSFSGTPSRSGYIFTGWSPSVKSTVTASQTYTAQWVVDYGESSGKVLARDKITLIHVDEHLDDIQNAQNTADEAAGNAAENEERISNAESSITQLADSISMLVTDEDGNSMMEQTSDGWRFNINTITDSLEETKDAIANADSQISELDQITSNLDSLVNDITQKTAYITMSTDDTGNPCIELGKQDSPFKLRITNESIDFVQDGVKIAYITNRQLYIQSSVVTDEMKVGAGSGFIWKKRSNGNMGLRWIEGN